MKVFRIRRPGDDHLVVGNQLIPEFEKSFLVRRIGT
jgi:hypothetical protein